MDLLMIARKIWRYRLVTLPVIVLTLVGGVYSYLAKESVYEASASYVLINPPDPPTDQEIARRPALGRINADNPYTRFTDQSVVPQVLARDLGSESARQALTKAGADDRYNVEPGDEFGYSTPIVEVTGVGSSPEAAIRTAEVVGDAVTNELNRMQQARGVDPGYRIKTQLVDAPDDAELKASGQLRVLIGVLAFGAVLLFVVVSVGDALTTLRTERMKPAAGEDAPIPEPLSVRDFFEDSSAQRSPPHLEGEVDEEHGFGSNGNSPGDGARRKRSASSRRKQPESSRRKQPASTRRKRSASSR
jgi:hypothetical protein